MKLPSSRSVILFGAAAAVLGALCYRRSVRRTRRACDALVEDFQERAIESFALLLDAKEEILHSHVQRVRVYALGLGRALGCTEDELRALSAGALLHDLGKIGVPDAVLGKEGKLTPDEFNVMKRHTLLGSQVLRSARFTYPLEEAVRSHHERWDGTGYPDGLAGEQIPLTARILSVVDFFDAVREDRPYRKGMTAAEALRLLKEGRGSHFDPLVVDTFIANLANFRRDIERHEANGVELHPKAEELSAAARACAPDAGFAEGP